MTGMIEKDLILHKVSDILNDSGAWQKIIELMESETMLEGLGDNYACNEIEQFIVDRFEKEMEE